MDMITLIKKADQGLISYQEFARSAESTDLISFVNEFSLEVARKFSNNELDYELCDGAMNYLFGFMTDKVFLKQSNNFIPSPALDIYDAFDAGEYNHRGDSRDVDPVTKYTIPSIKEILSSERT
jgi:hypothetical protein